MPGARDDEAVQGGMAGLKPRRSHVRDGSAVANYRAASSPVIIN